MAVTDRNARRQVAVPSFAAVNGKTMPVTTQIRIRTIMMTERGGLRAAFNTCSSRSKPAAIPMSTNSTTPSAMTPEGPMWLWLSSSTYVAIDSRVRASLTKSGCKTWVGSNNAVAQTSHAKDAPATTTNITTRGCESQSTNFSFMRTLSASQKDAPKPLVDRCSVAVNLGLRCKNRTQAGDVTPRRRADSLLERAYRKRVRRSNLTGSRPDQRHFVAVGTRGRTLSIKGETHDHHP